MEGAQEDLRERRAVKVSARGSYSRTGGAAARRRIVRKPPEGPTASGAGETQATAWWG